MSKPTLLLVHGAWCGAWVWDPIATALNSCGLSWHAIDCVGSSSKRKFGWVVSADAVANDIVSEARHLAGPVMLVGHSAGGMAISRAADRAPDLFAGLVYVCAFLPRNGDRLLRLLHADEGSDFGSAVRVNPLKGTVALLKSRLRDFLFHDCTLQDYEHYMSRVGEDPLRLGPAKTKLGVGFDRLPKHYIQCTEDRALSPAFQEWMVGRQPVQSELKMSTGHMPMYADPQRLASMFDELAQSCNEAATR